MLGGESFFINTYTAWGSPGEVTVGPSLPGDIVHLALTGQTVFVQSGSYLACGTGIEVDTEWGGAKTFFSSEGLFLLKCSGAGNLIVSSDGAIKQLDLAAGQIYRMDTGHMVAFSEGTGCEVQKVGGWKSTLLSGEGLVVNLTGPGRVWMQTRSPSSFHLLDRPAAADPARVGVSPGRRRGSSRASARSRRPAWRSARHSPRPGPCRAGRR